MELTNHAVVVIYASTMHEGRSFARFGFSDGRRGAQWYLTFAEARRHMHMLGADSVEIIVDDTSPIPAEPID